MAHTADADANPVAVLAKAAFQHVRHAEFLGDCRYVDLAAAERKRRGSRDDLEAALARQQVQDFVRYAIREVAL